MPLSAAVGESKAIQAREAGSQAALQALDQAVRTSIVFGFVIASHVHQFDQVVAGVVDSLGDIPLLGFSSCGELTSGGLSRRSVLVALLCSEEVKGQAGWWPDFIVDSQTCAIRMLHELQPDGDDGDILIVVPDGLNGDATILCQALSGAYSLFGCLAGGVLWRGRTFQLGGRESGAGGLAAAVLRGNLAIGVGAAHGWQPVGALARLTRVQAQWVREMDKKQTNETYARLFGYSPREWVLPPLNDIVRLYPLGLRQKGDLVVRSPLRMEADGSLRMNSVLKEGELVEFLVGTQDGCLKAAQKATEDALMRLGRPDPKLALVLMDSAWRAIFELQPGGEIDPVRAVLGEDVPIIGGYTYGQIARFEPSGPAELLNQHILVTVFGEKPPGLYVDAEE